MQSIATWLERPVEKIGLDNLGTQQPCVFIYSNLLPGVTNVTDRTSYFSYYPWFIRAFERRRPDASDAEFREALRKSDCLVTLVAERHGVQSPGLDESIHAGACPGRQKLGPAAQEVASGNARLRLSTYAERSEENAKRYFKNPLGGLGQYYLGPLRDEYRILAGDARRGVKYTIEHGLPLADAFGGTRNEDRFFAIVANDELSATDLDALHEFCPCSLREPEHEPTRAAVARMLLDDQTPNGSARRRTFDLILMFLRHADGIAVRDPVKAFLRACYTRTLPTGAWRLRGPLEAARDSWGLYARNEMMSVAWIAIFKLCLDEMAGPPRGFARIGALCDDLLTSKAFAYRPDGAFNDVLRADRKDAPSLEEADSASHEVKIWDALISRSGPKLEDAARMLIRLVARFSYGRDSYAQAGVASASLSPYPLTLNTLSGMAQRRWSGLGGHEWLRGLLVEVLTAHQRVAIRKMGQSGEDTLMFRSNDQGFFVHRPQERVVETQPRLVQALQILRDLGFVEYREGYVPKLTEAGVRHVEALEQ